MSTLVVPQVASGLSNEQLADLVAKLAKEVDWFSRNIDSKNVRNIAGYNVSEFEIKHMSGIVGMSGYDYANPNAVRFWSGNADKNAAPFRVTQGGKLYATDGNFTGRITGSTIIGSYITTADGTYPRIDFSSSGNLLAAYQSATNYISIEPNSFSGNPGLRLHSPLGEGTWRITDNFLSLLTPLGSLQIQIGSGSDLFLTANNAIKLEGSSLTIDNIAGYTGSFSVITGVNFTSSTTTSKTVTVRKGIVTSVS